MLDTCGRFPGPGHGSVTHYYNPMSEFFPPQEELEDHRKSADPSTRHVRREFERFKKHHGKAYGGRRAEVEAHINFLHNHRFIQSSNRRNMTFALKLNHLSDRSVEQMRVLLGRLFSKGYNGGQQYTVKPDSAHKPLPESFDWRILGAVNPVKDQAICGSCWSFGTTGTIEGVYFARTGHLLRLSEQQLIDCSWNRGDNGCDGGEDWRAYEYIKSVGGIALEDDYGHYLGQDGKCHDGDVPKAVLLDGFVNVTTHDPAALKRALVDNGPITIAINANARSFSFYSHGVYNDKACGSRLEDMDHQVLLVGYGKLANSEYWLVKNSWSTNWGNDGYILIDIKDNICGVTNQPTYPNVK